jgi:hypothetical protein
MSFFNPAVATVTAVTRQYNNPSATLYGQGIDDSIDKEMHTYTVNGTGHTFKCIPSRTTNFDLFCLSNPKLGRSEAETIWNYYREQFIRATLCQFSLSRFRENLKDFIFEKSKNVERDVFSGTTNKASRHEQIDKMISLALWLELQYRIDTTCVRLSENVSVEGMLTNAATFLKTAIYNNYVSYFAKSERFAYDPEEYKNRKLFVKNVFEFSHRNNHYYICESNIGAVEIHVDRKHSPFIVNFSKQINEGVEVNVVTSEIRTNIDNTVPILVIKNWFIE